MPDKATERHIIRDLIVEQIRIDSLKVNPINARTHSKAQIRQISKSLETFGWTNPILIDSEKSILAGHGRVEGAKLLGLTEVPAIKLADLSPEQQRAYILADNKLAQNAGWDENLLAIELKELSCLDLDFDLTITGFETGEIDFLIEGLDQKVANDHVIPEATAGVPVTRSGDLWHIGPHRLLCGNALEPAEYDRLMAGDQANMVFTDPPYNVPINGHVTGLGRNHHSDFAMAFGEMSSEEFTTFLETAFKAMSTHCSNGSLHYICMDWRHLFELTTAGNRTFSEMINLCVWVKTNGGMGSLYRSQHELITVFKLGKQPHTNNVLLGKHGRNRTNVWNYAGQNSFGKGRDDTLALHPTVKPIRMVEDAIKDATNLGDIILDPFLGSGTTILAAARAGRIGYGMELDPSYCDVILTRLQQELNETAILSTTGKAFDDLKTEQEEQKSND